MRNINIIDIETAESFKVLFDSWNCRTNVCLLLLSAVSSLELLRVRAAWLTGRFGSGTASTSGLSTRVKSPVRGRRWRRF